MSAAIGYSIITDAAFAAAVAEAWPIIGDTAPSAWLEHPTRADGLLLRDGDVEQAEALQWLATWPEGRVFCSRGELRWMRLAAAITTTKVVIPSEARNPGS